MLVGLTSFGTEKQKEIALNALIVLTLESPMNQEALHALGAVDVLVALARTGTNQQQEIAVTLLRNIAGCLRHQEAIWAVQRSALLSRFTADTISIAGGRRRPAEGAEGAEIALG